MHAVAKASTDIPSLKDHGLFREQCLINGRFLG